MKKKKNKLDFIQKKKKKKCSINKILKNCNKNLKMQLRKIQMDNNLMVFIIIVI